MKINPIELLASLEKATEAEEYTPDTIQYQMPTGTDKNLFLTMLYKYLGNTKFTDMVNTLGSDMEIYNMVSKYDTLKENLSTYGRTKTEKLCDNAYSMAAKYIALSEQDPLIDQYNKLRSGMDAVSDMIVAKYGSAAKNVVKALLTEHRDRAQSMVGAGSDDLRSAISDMLSNCDKKTAATLTTDTAIAPAVEES